MKFERSSGVLLHPTSLPGPYGIGDLGPHAHEWVRFLGEVGCGLWQILPLGPTGYGDSPYQSFSAFAGNHYLISPELLLEDGLLIPDDLVDKPNFPEGRVDFGALIPWKSKLLDKAFERFQDANQFDAEFWAFRETCHLWLEEYALFMSLKDAHGGVAWVDWPAPLCQRDITALDAARQEYKEEIQKHIFRQFVFFRQWGKLKDIAAENRVRIVGDIPIYVSHDSADVWVHQPFYSLDSEGQPTVVAGVPPDYFSSTGQLWGNPLYRWEVHKSDGFRWWLARFRSVLDMVDIVRLDHFRGFAGYWEVPAGQKTAENGRWVDGPGEILFYAVKDSLGDLPIIAEDLGHITPDVFELRDKFNLPGMKILQFAFIGEPDHPFLPHMYPINCVSYTGTHDNDTVHGYFESAPESEVAFCRQYFSMSGDDYAWTLIEGLWASQAIMAITTLQDLLNLGTEARMNFPSRLGGNWTWRMPEDALGEALGEKLQELNEKHGRSTKAGG